MPWPFYLLPQCTTCFHEPWATGFVRGMLCESRVLSTGQPTRNQKGAACLRVPFLGLVYGKPPKNGVTHMKPPFFVWVGGSAVCPAQTLVDCSFGAKAARASWSRQRSCRRPSRAVHRESRGDMVLNITGFETRNGGHQTSVGIHVPPWFPLLNIIAIRLLLLSAGSHHAKLEGGLQLLRFKIGSSF